MAIQELPASQGGLETRNNPPLINLDDFEPVDPTCQDCGSLNVEMVRRESPSS